MPATELRKEIKPTRKLALASFADHDSPRTMVTLAKWIAASAPNAVEENRVCSFLGGSPDRVRQTVVQVADCDWDMTVCLYDSCRGPSLAQSNQPWAELSPEEQRQILADSGLIQYQIWTELTPKEQGELLASSIPDMVVLDVAIADKEGNLKHIYILVDRKIYSENQRKMGFYKQYVELFQATGLPSTGGLSKNVSRTVKDLKGTPGQSRVSPSPVDTGASGSPEYPRRVKNGKTYELRPSNGGTGPNRWHRVYDD